MARFGFGSAIALVCLMTISSCRSESEVAGRLPVPSAKRVMTAVSLPSTALGGGAFRFHDVDPDLDLVEQALRGQTTGLEERVSRLVASQKDDHAAWQLSHIYWLIHADALEHGESTEKLEVLDGWVDSQPKLHLARLARGAYLDGLAWRSRGTGFAHEVTEEGARRFRQYGERARADYEAAKRLEPADPNAAVMLINSALSDGSNRSEMEALYADALAMAPGHFGARTAKLTYLMPKWHGSDEEMLAFAYECLDESGQHPYAALILAEAFLERHLRPSPSNASLSVFQRIVGGEENTDDEVPFLHQGNAWRAVEDAFDRFFSRYPEDLAQRYRYFDVAYFADQYDVAIEQAEIIGERWIMHAPHARAEDYLKKAAFSYLTYAEQADLTPRDLRYFLAHATQLRPDDAKIRASYGISLQTAKLWAEAEREYRHALRLEPTNTVAYTGLITLHGRSPSGCGEVLRLWSAARNLEFDPANNREIASGLASRCERYRSSNG